ncbi:unnamed protein product, partial [marine sediment metagenome]
LKPSKYIFLREVSGVSLDYRHMIEGQLAEICPYLKDMGIDLVLSLENKSLKRKFEDQCIILNEPVSDIHSLMHYALMTISSGDTMARESCLVGTPSIYTGGLKISVNDKLEEKQCLFLVEPGKTDLVLETIQHIIENNVKKKTEKMIKEAIKTEWEDTTQIIIDNLMDYQ